MADRKISRTNEDNEAAITSLTNTVNNVSVKNFGTIDDSSSLITLNCANAQQSKGFINTTEASLGFNFTNFGEISNIVVRTNTTTNVNLQGPNLLFIDLDNIAAADVSINLSCANLYNEISINKSGDSSTGGQAVLLVVKK